MYTSEILMQMSCNTLQYLLQDTVTAMEQLKKDKYNKKVYYQEYRKLNQNIMVIKREIKRRETSRIDKILNIW